MPSDPAVSNGSSNVSPRDHFFFEGSGTPELFRASDWSQRSIGQPSTWPQSLQTALSIVLPSRRAACLIWGPDRICFFNEAFAGLLGVSHAGTFGQSFPSVWPPTWNDETLPLLEWVEQTGRGTAREHLMPLPSGKNSRETRSVTLAFAPVRSEGGKVGGILAEITESFPKVADGQRTPADTRDDHVHAPAGLTECEERSRAVADNAPLLMWFADAGNDRTWFNRSWLTFAGRSSEQESGGGWVDNIHPDDRPRSLNAYRKACDQCEVFSFEYRLRRHDGIYRWLLDTGGPRFEGGRLAGFTGFCIDISDLRAAESAMHESRNAERARRQELEALTQNAPAGIWMAHDPECRTITGNAAAHAMLRIPPGRNLSHSGTDWNSASVTFLQNGKPVETANLAMRVAARTGQTVANQELEFRFPDGTSTWVYGSATPLVGENGKVRGVICVMVDVTEWKRVEAALRFSENQLKFITDHTAVMLAQLDRNHRYRFVNRTYCDRYKRSLHELIGAHVSEVIGPEPYKSAEPFLAKALAGEVTEFELYYPGFSRWGHVLYQPERSADGTILGLVAVVIDITRQKLAEIELQRARDEALAASRAKDDFLAALSHELRTPLSPVLLLASESAADVKLSARVRKDFATIRKCVELEARLIDDLLDLTRITRGKLVLERMKLDLAVVLQDALATVSADLQLKQIDLVVEKGAGSVWIWGDPVRLQQVFWNILKNAVKFTPWGGRVLISSRVDPQQQSVAVGVQDTGIGITGEEIGRVFEAFAQGDHATTDGSHRFGGLGLGLAISRRVVELHDGRITAESAGRNTGATFRVELPLFDSVAANAIPETRSREAASEKDNRILSQRSTTSHFESAIDGQVFARKRPAALSGRILLVEDHAPTRIALEQLLIRRNYAVRSAASVAEARELARRESFAVLISDIGLPDGNGYELMKELRAEYGMVGVSLTGYGTEEDVSRSQSAGFVRHLTKPVRMQSLDEALAGLPLPSQPR